MGEMASPKIIPDHRRSERNGVSKLLDLSEDLTWPRVVALMVG